jgi:hypothetical protein
LHGGTEEKEEVSGARSLKYKAGVVNKQDVKFSLQSENNKR